MTTEAVIQNINDFNLWYFIWQYDLHICIAEKEEDHPPSLSIVKELMEAYPDINVKITTGLLA